MAFASEGLGLVWNDIHTRMFRHPLSGRAKKSNISSGGFAQTATKIPGCLLMSPSKSPTWCSARESDVPSLGQLRLAFRRTCGGSFARDHP